MITEMTPNTVPLPRGLRTSSSNRRTRPEAAARPGRRDGD